MRLIPILLLLMTLMLPCMASEQVTFTVKDREIRDVGVGSWCVIIYTVDDSVYYVECNNIIVSSFPTDKACDMWKIFASNTTHTVNVNGHEILL